jgi:hypothetical protein
MPADRARSSPDSRAQRLNQRDGDGVGGIGSDRSADAVHALRPEQLPGMTGQGVEELSVGEQLGVRLRSFDRTGTEGGVARGRVGRGDSQDVPIAGLGPR